MYIYNKNDKSYTFSSDDINIENSINNNIEPHNNETPNDSERSKPRNIEVIDGGNDLDISPVSDYIDIEKPKNDKKENIVIPEDNK